MSKGPSTATKVIAIFLSIFMVIAVLCTTVLWAMSSLTSAKTITNMIEQIDIVELIPEETINKEEAKQAAAVVDDIIDSDAGKEIVGALSQDVNDVLLGKDTPSALNKDKISSIIKNNKDDFTNVVKKATNGKITEEMVEKDFDKVTEDVATEIAEVIPDKEYIKTLIPQEVTSYTKLIVDPTLTIILAIVSGVLAILIYICRYKGFAGFLWLGIDSIICTVLVGAVALIINFAKSFISSMLGSGGELIESSVGAFNDSFITATIILSVISVVFLFVYTILKKTTKKETEQEN